MSGGWSPPFRLVAAVAVGGAAGATLRYAIETIWPSPTGSWPVAIFAVNLVGCFVLGLLGGFLSHREILGRGPADWVRPLLITGVLGGFTTFSTMMVDAVNLADAQGILQAMAYLAASCALGLLLLSLGWYLGVPGNLRAATDELAESEQA